MTRITLFLLALFFLLGSFCVGAIICAFRRIPKKDIQKILHELTGRFFYRKAHLYFFPSREYEGLFFSAICAQNISRYLFAALSTAFLMVSDIGEQQLFGWFWWAVSFLLFLFISFFVGDYLPRIFGTKSPESALRACSPVGSVFLYLVFPITYLFLRASQMFSIAIYIDRFQEPDAQAKQEIIELINEAPVMDHLDPNEKKLIKSVLKFRDKVTREVMVPRVDIFSLSAETTIRQAAKLLRNEGYSRMPVHKNSIDNIIGVLMYKDILNMFMEVEMNSSAEEDLLAQPIEIIAKPALFIPETKKISELLQEFRKKQVHFAIVVDEYGGTEGIITIEDILEEIVGEIEDEYDSDEEIPFTALADGSWAIDARMSILDVESELGIKIPQQGEYDTVGGYIFHRTGSIPPRGFTIEQDDFELEVLRSTERSIEKVKITPVSIKKEQAPRE